MITVNKEKIQDLVKSNTDWLPEIDINKRLSEYVGEASGLIISSIFSNEDSLCYPLMQSDLVMEFCNSEGVDDYSVISIDVKDEIISEIRLERESIASGGSTDRIEKFIATLQSLIDYAKAP